MLFRPLPVILFGLLSLAALVWADRPLAAVAFVDVKFDDKAAVWSLLLDRRYSKVIAITSGVNAHGQAALELQQYLQRQNDMANVKFDMNKFEVMQGTNALAEAAPHERWWKGQPVTTVTEAYEASMRQRLHGYRVRVFQIAPTHPDQIQAVLQAADRGSVETYMLLHGYNSRQVNKEWETYFLRNLRSWVYGNNPQASVFFTSSADSYATGNGGKQPFTAIQHMFPEHDLDQAMKDPFWSGQLLRTHKLDVENKIPAFPVQDQKQLDEIIYNARVHPNDPVSKQWREYLRKYIENALKYNPGKEDQIMTLWRLRNTHLPEFSGPTTLELADASHIAAFHRYMDGGRRSGMWTEPVAYPPGPHAEGKKVQFVPATQDELHGLLLKGANRDQDLAYIKRLAGTQ